MSDERHHPIHGQYTTGTEAASWLPHRYLVFMIIANSATTLMYLVGAEDIRRKIPEIPQWSFPVLIVGAILNLVFAIALLRWKKWGFWGFVATSVVIFLVNLSLGFTLGPALVGLLGVAILYGVLHIGKERQGWSQLD
jgi:cytochrome bd-type quinol oxidase subunit 2